MRWTKVSGNSQLYLEHQTVYTPRGEESSVYSHKDKPRVTNILLHRDSLLVATPGRSMKTHSKSKFIF